MEGYNVKDPRCLMRAGLYFCISEASLFTGISGSLKTPVVGKPTQLM